ncbi:MAG: DUF3168 domain-containing protein [Alphaproteobacteria bacterium]|nr:DUF3168 domain-containing protein [Alphaproteobacteria bacterium]
MSHASWGLQKALYAALSAAPALQAALGDPPRIYDDVPAGARFPYLTLGEMQEREAGAGATEASEILITLHLWSRGGGRREAREILSVLRALMEGATLPMEGQRLANLTFQWSDALLESDGETYHGLARYRALIERNP